MPRPSPGCPLVGRDTVLERPDEGDGQTLSIAPGLHRPRAGAHALTVWDPRALVLDVEPEGGLRREGLLLDLGAESAGAQVAQAHQEWRAARAAAREAGVRPLHRPQTVTAAARAIAEEALLHAGEAPEEPGGAAPALERASLARPGDDVQFEAVPERDASRAGGARFGTLVHAVLALADLRASIEESSAQARALAASVGRSLGADATEIAHAARAAQEALAHPLMQRAAQSADCRREVELFRVEADGAILEGVADLAFREEGPRGPRWLVVDFKTDLDPQAEPKYFAQLRLYARAIAEATGEPATPVLFAV